LNEKGTDNLEDESMKKRIKKAEESNYWLICTCPLSELL
jgi:hypothetical protein